MAPLLLLLLMANASASTRDGGSTSQRHLLHVALPGPAGATCRRGGSRETPVLRLCGGKPGPSGEGPQRRDAGDGKNGHAARRKRDKRQVLEEKRKQPETGVVLAEKRKRKKRAKEVAGNDSASRLSKGDPAKLGLAGSPDKLQNARLKHRKEGGGKRAEKTVDSKLDKLVKKQGKVSKQQGKVNPQRKVAKQEERRRHEKRKQSTKPTNVGTVDILLGRNHSSEKTTPPTDTTEQELERQTQPPHGMALARRLMHNMGWSGDGHGLGLNGTGPAARPCCLPWSLSVFLSLASFLCGVA